MAAAVGQISGCDWREGRLVSLVRSDGRSRVSLVRKGCLIDWEDDESGIKTDFDWSEVQVNFVT